MNSVLLILLFVAYIPVAALCLLAVLFRKEQSQERMSQEWLSKQARQVLEQGREERL